MSLLAPGTVLQHRYQIVQPLGQGGMGAVYLAEDLELFHRQCVIKEMMTPYASQTERLKAERDFEREAELLSQLNLPGHPNIPEIYGYFTVRNSHFLAMKYIAGESLEERLDRVGRYLPEKEVIRFMIPVCDALSYMHTRPEPVTHRDIKPANIIVDGEGRVWLVDFGLAKATAQSGAMVMLQGGKTIAAGTPGYTPLEQWEMRPAPKSDVFALGATMHHLLTAQDPRDKFASFPTLDLATLRELSPLSPVRQVRPILSKDIERIIIWTLQEDPALRPSAEQLKAELEKMVAGFTDRLLLTVQSWQPDVGEILGKMLATVVERLLSRSPELPRREREVTRRGMIGVCLYCGGTGTKRGRRCPVCGGSGKW